MEPIPNSLRFLFWNLQPKEMLTPQKKISSLIIERGYALQQEKINVYR
jgi:hypothetical protein|tara:strand:- start:542 stop:685 length:144 start_codon:yes stop_codon:yes gene_type:complete